MRYELRLTAYDCLDNIVVAWTLTASDASDPPQRQAILSGHESLRGVGEDDPSAWIRDALVMALERA
jgi:hypothetical protein